MTPKRSMALACTVENSTIIPEKKGADRYVKASYPLRYGKYAEIETSHGLFHFNLNGEIIRIIGKAKNWPHPQEWLKRTVGNDWIYYSTGGYTGVFETTGEYYLPNLPYPTNNNMGGKPLEIDAVRQLIDNWPRLLAPLAERKDLDREQRLLIETILDNTPKKLAEKGKLFHQLAGGIISVLPPDTRHVDYNVIPLTVARGCLYKCSFCKVKNKNLFTELSKAEIESQLNSLADFYHHDLKNHNGLFLGEHDCLKADPELICFSIDRAQHILNLHRAYMKGWSVFMFGSVTSLLEAPDDLFQSLEQLGGSVYINIGLESVDQSTIDYIGKPVKATEVLSAFDRMQEINDRFRNIEITGNFVTGQELPDNHFTSLATLLNKRLARPRGKGSMYLSEMKFDNPSRARLFDFYRFKLMSKLPLFLYTIQRL